jgi:hypothetical protein
MDMSLPLVLISEGQIDIALLRDAQIPGMPLTASFQRPGPLSHQHL